MPMPFTRGALHHLPGLGAETLRHFARIGVRTWDDVLATTLSGGARARVAECVFACDGALQRGDLAYLAGALDARDHWRLLADHWDQASFFDIETTGLRGGVEITLISCLHGDCLHHFVRGETLDDFLGLLGRIKLLVSFNGSTFDVPRLLQHFHIPGLPCAHLDLRWLCKHQGWTGGLKAIEARLNMARPDEIRGMDGAEAELMWKLWEVRRDGPARRRLIRYCGADVVATKRVAARLLGEAAGAPFPAPDGWDVREAAPDPARSASAEVPGPAPPAAPEEAHYRRLRAHAQRQRARSTAP